MRRQPLIYGLALVLGAAAVGQAATFRGLGLLNGLTAEVRGLSADGKLAVGSYGPDLLLPFRWTQGTGLKALPLPAGGEGRGGARAATADGSIIVGYGSTAEVPLNEAVRWVDGGAPVGLGELPGGAANSEAFDVSADGAVIVGKSVSGGGVTAFRRTEAEGLQSLGYLTGGGFGTSHAFAVSGDGSTVVGSSISPNPSSTLFGEAFRWTSDGGMKGLGHLPADPGLTVGSVAYDVSGDGSLVVGVSSVLQMSVGVVRTEAFRWTEATGMVGLGDLDGDGVFSAANAISADGAIIVGSGRTDQGERAFIWDEANGMRNLRDVLVEDYKMGSALAGWTLRTATAISADGMVIAGVGRNPGNQIESWVVDLYIIPGDANWDNKVDLVDFGILKANFGTGTTLEQGDFNGDGKVDLSDFGVLKANFGQGGSAAVSEPSTALLMAAACLALLARRWSRLGFSGLARESAGG